MVSKIVKRTICSMMLGMTFMAGVALAAGEVNVTDKTAFIFPGKDSGYFYAKIENTGDAPVGVDSGQMVLFSNEDDILETSSYISTYPNRLILNPGEYTYIREFLWNSSLENQTVGDVKFTVSDTDKGREVRKIPCEVSLDMQGSDSFENYINVTVTNEDSEVRYNYYLVVALMDTAGNLIYVDENAYEHVGLHPGSTATFGLYIDNDIVEYFEANGIEAGSVDALVYYIEE